MAKSSTSSLPLLEKLRLREALYASIRTFFSARQVNEVSTPILSEFACPEPSIEPLRTHFHSAGLQQSFYLQTSPEFAMKKLLAAGLGSIFQICPVFRDCDLGRYHHPEFTLLEWYRVGMGYQDLIDEVECLLKTCMLPWQPLADTHKLSYKAAFEQTIQLNPLTVTITECRQCCERLGIVYPDSMTDEVDEWLDLLITHAVAPQFSNNALTIIYDYPKSQAALAQLRYSEEDQLDVAERFEVYYGPIELANGFHELWDANEQQQRFEQENQQRRQRQQNLIDIDYDLIEALTVEMPECSGVALGLERLLMVMHGIDHINDVILFPNGKV